MDITQLLTFSVQQKASDLHISAGLPPMLRIDGDVRKINAPELDASQAQALLYDVMNDFQRKEFETNLECDFSFNLPGVARFRANVFRQERGIGGVFRTIPTRVLTLEELNAPSVFSDIANTPRGLVLVTGPTGSGKSTTLAAMIDYINERHYAHILTVEDPIEFVHNSKNSLINQREVHRDTRSFSNALRAALREDPDVILVGEMRDLETIKLALTAAETGHLVFGTLHTSSAAKTIDRIIDVFPGNEKTLVRSMLSESLRAVISQTLVKRKNGGRVAAHEIMLGNAAIRNLIREDKVPQMYSIIQTIGRAARNVNGRVILYADKITESMRKAMEETERRRAKQIAYNEKLGVQPQSLNKRVEDMIDVSAMMGKNQVNSRKKRASNDDNLLVAAEEVAAYAHDPHSLAKQIGQLEKAMHNEAKALNFEAAAQLRDQIKRLRQLLVS